MQLAKKVSAQKSELLLLTHRKKKDINVIEGLNSLDFDYLEPLGRLIVQAKNSKILAK